MKSCSFFDERSKDMPEQATVGLKSRVGSNFELREHRCTHFECEQTMPVPLYEKLGEVGGGSAKLDAVGVSGVSVRGTHPVIEGSRQREVASSERCEQELDLWRKLRSAQQDAPAHGDQSPMSRGGSDVGRAFHGKPSPVFG